MGDCAEARGRRRSGGARRRLAQGTTRPLRVEPQRLDRCLRFGCRTCEQCRGGDRLHARRLAAAGFWFGFGRPHGLLEGHAWMGCRVSRSKHSAVPVCVQRDHTDASDLPEQQHHHHSPRYPRSAMRRGGRIRRTGQASIHAERVRHTMLQMVAVTRTIRIHRIAVLRGRSHRGRIIPENGVRTTQTLAAQGIASRIPYGTAS